ncbi:hypothetical protein KY285_010212 [Solanum tuberosum]|uniref:Uncharacterized protein n=1 Tax=Solanum tuberosum TaxID=4113 RepID=M1DBI5_SOLTU|nr:hypothetical protein KY285_010212 [Solanum tuberosum]
MAAQPPAVVLKPPDQVEMMHNSETQLLQQESPTNSNHNSRNLNSSQAMTVHLSEDKLKWAQQIISMAKSRVIQIIPVDGMNFTPIELPMVTKSKDSLLPIERFTKANCEESSPKSP